MNYEREDQVVHWTLQYKLNTRHQSFTDFIHASLARLEKELVNECERIVVRRELNLKLQAIKAHAKIDALESEIQLMRQRGASATETQLVRQKAARMCSEADGASDAGISEQRAENGPSRISAVRPSVLREPIGGVTVPQSTASASCWDAEDGDDADVDELSKAAACFASQKEQLEKGTADVELDGQHPVLVMSDEEETDQTPAHHATARCPSFVIEESDNQHLQEEVVEFRLWSEWTQPLHTLLKTVSAASMIEAEHYEPSSRRLDHDWTRSFFLEAQEETKNWCKEGCTLAPYSCGALSWEFLGLPVLVYDLVTLPLQVFWKHDEHVGAAVGWFIIIYWTLDVFLRMFFIGYISGRHQVELRRRKIMRHYMRGSFAFDLLLVLPDWIFLCLDLPRNIAILRVFRLMRFMRLTRMSKLQRTARKLQDLVDSEYYQVYLNICWNVLTMMGSCHYIACFWYWIGTGNVHGYGSWVDNYADYDWEYQYFTSMHWALCQFTPGSLKVEPSNIKERVIAILVLIWGLVFFSLFVSSVTQERMKLKILTKKMDRDNWILRRYLKQQRVPRGLGIRVGKYVDAFVTPMMMRVQRKDVSLLEHLSRPLQLEVQAEIYNHTLLVHPFFETIRAKSGSMASSLFANVVAEISLAKNDLFFEAGQVCHEMFFVSRGCLGYLSSGTSDKHKVQHVKERDWCCEQVLWIPWIHRGTVRAVGESYLLSVDSAKFRVEVLEYRERAYVRACAQAYLEDLKQLGASGFMVDDLIHVGHDDSEFLKVCRSEGEVVSNISSNKNM